MVPQRLDEAVFPVEGVPRPVRKSKFYGAFVLNHRVVLHAIDATPARRRGGVNSSPLGRARTAASSPGNVLVENCRVHPTHWLISTQPATSARAARGRRRRVAARPAATAAARGTRRGPAAAAAARRAGRGPRRRPRPRPRAPRAPTRRSRRRAGRSPAAAGSRGRRQVYEVLRPASPSRARSSRGTPRPGGPCPAPRPRTWTRRSRA